MIKCGSYLYISLIVALFSCSAGAAVDICSCINEPIVTDARAISCGKLLDKMTPEETVRVTGKCNAQLAQEKGLDVCVCLKTFQTDPDIIKACEKIIGKDAKPSDMVRMAEQCD